MKNYDCYKKSGTKDYKITYSEYEPISAWGYVGYNILWSIPVIGWLIFLCHALTPNESARRSYARSFFCALLVSVILIAVAVIGVYAFIMIGFGSVEMFLEMMAQYGFVLPG